jgi:outer membrane lipoprotein-sorting protein
VPSTFPILRSSLLALLGTGLVLTASAAQTKASESPSARQILDQMAQVYAGCTSYRDSGVVRTVFVSVRGNRTVEKPFTTAFVRPDRFRFEYREKRGILEQDSRYIVWSQGKETRAWWDLDPEVRKGESLGMALAAATGVSSGSAHTIPALLLPAEVEGRRLTDITEARRMDDARLDDVECFRIEGKLAQSPATLWIDKSSFLVRRLDERHQLPTFSTEETTTYDPVINGEIGEEMLAFAPPDRVGG